MMNVVGAVVRSMHNLFVRPFFKAVLGQLGATCLDVRGRDHVVGVFPLD